MTLVGDFFRLLQLAWRLGGVKLMLTMNPANLASFGITHPVAMIIIGKVDDHARLEIPPGIFVWIDHDGIGMRLIQNRIALERLFDLQAI